MLLVFEMVREGAVDMAVSDLTIHSRRVNLVDLSQSYCPMLWIRGHDQAASLG
jgi:hypothetical protein